PVVDWLHVGLLDRREDRDEALDLLQRHLACGVLGSLRVFARRGRGGRRLFTPRVDRQFLRRRGTRQQQGEGEDRKTTAHAGLRGKSWRGSRIGPRGRARVLPDYAASPWERPWPRWRGNCIAAMPDPTGA